jgi:hypothetical protein
VIAYGCCVGSWDRFQRYVVPHVRGRLIATSGHEHIAVAYNTILDAFDGRTLPDALVLLHDDLELIDPDAEMKFVSALSDADVALVGVAGTRTCTSLAWWDRDTIGHQHIDSQLLDFGARTGDVTALEGSIIVLSPWAIQHLRFDETYLGFHGYDCDIAMQARRAGRRVVVADVDTHHHVQLGFKTPESAAGWCRADQLFREKWCEGDVTNGATS